VRYVSTRGEAPVLGFEDVLLTGLARDGGLYVPESWPEFSAAEIRAMAGKSYREIALEVMMPFVGDAIDRPAMAEMVDRAYDSFDHRAVVPLRQIGDNDWLLELFHGPTLAFKDVAMQLLGRLFDHVLSRRGERVTIVGATSGDTGSAAIEGCRGRDAIDIFILYPHGRVSDIQRRQMTTTGDPNVHCIALDGTFDDCQDLLKALFNDGGFRDRLRLSAVNSINWARVMAQIVYYFAAAVRLGGPDRPMAFTVPTGNFGDIFAGYAAQRMGLPIQLLRVATNRNDILARFFSSGDYRMGEVSPTMSPSMDIQISSNFERLLFDLCDRDGTAVHTKMAAFKQSGAFSVDPEQLATARQVFDAHRVDEDETLDTISESYRAAGLLIDPHTAIGIKAAAVKRPDPTIPMISLATAHPAKFPESVARAVGLRPRLPARLAGLLERDENRVRLGNDFDAVRRFISDNARILRNGS